MIPQAQTAAAFAAAFLVGSIPCSYIVVKLRTGRDIRTMGSGNAGATNVFRSVGKPEGWVTLAGDFSKGAAAVAVGAALCGESTPADPVTLRFLMGIAAMAGHVFTPFLGFREGKGVATGAGMTLAVLPVNFAVAFAVWLGVLLTTQFMSVASIAGAYAFVASAWVLLGNCFVSWAALCGALFITWTHRTNLRRLFRGEENRTVLINRHNSK